MNKENTIDKRVDMEEQKFREEWWEVRNLVKPKIMNEVSPITRKQWKHIKKNIKRVLKDYGKDSALRFARKYFDY